MRLASKDKQEAVAVITNVGILEAWLGRSTEEVGYLNPLKGWNGHVGEWLGVNMEKA